MAISEQSTSVQRGRLDALYLARSISVRQQATYDRKLDLVSRALAEVYVDDQLTLGGVPGNVSLAGSVLRQHDAASG